MIFQSRNIVQCRVCLVYQQKTDLRFLILRSELFKVDFHQLSICWHHLTELELAVEQGLLVCVENVYLIPRDEQFLKIFRISRSQDRSM